MFVRSLFLTFVRSFVRSFGPHITLNAFFSAVCRWIDLKFGRDLHVDLLFQFLLLFFLSSSSSFSLFSFLASAPTGAMPSHLITYGCSFRTPIRPYIRPYVCTYIRTYVRPYVHLRGRKPDTCRTSAVRILMGNQNPALQKLTAWGIPGGCKMVVGYLPCKRPPLKWL